MSTTQDQIRANVDAFVTQLTALVQQAAFDQLRAALGESPAVATTTAAVAAKPSPAEAPAKRGRPRKVTPAAAPAAAATKATAAKPAAKTRKKGAKRDPMELADLVERLYGYIKGHPGQRMEHIKKGLGVDKSELTLPVAKLIDAKRITAKGVKRATTYLAA